MELAKRWSAAALQRADPTLRRFHMLEDGVKSTDTEQQRPRVRKLTRLCLLLAAVAGPAAGLAQSIQVTFPDGNQNLVRGTTYVIRWTSSGLAPGTVAIQLRQNGALLGAIASVVPLQNGQYTWQHAGYYEGGLQAPTGGGYTVEVSSENVAVSGQSPPFLLLPELNVNTPNGGESWVIGSTQAITWSTSLAGTLRIDLLSNGIQAGRIKSSVASGALSYSWPAGALEGGGTAPAGTYQVLLTSVENPNISSASAQSFRLTAPVGPIAVTAPNGGEVWLRGSPHNITWSSSLGGNVSISLLRNGQVLGPIASAPAAAGAYPWLVGAYVGLTAPAGSGYQIRVSSESSPQYQDLSDTAFTIQPEVVVVAPNGTESWPLGSSQTIRWSTSLVGTVGIRLLRAGAVVGTITASTPASAQSFTWNAGSLVGGAPAPAANNYRLQIYSTASPTVQDTSDQLFALTAAASSSHQTWDLSRDLANGFGTNPKGPWAWMEGSTASIHNPATYALLPTYTPSACVGPGQGNLPCWQDLANAFTLIGAPTANLLSAQFPLGKGVPFLHPGVGKPVIVRWTSPFSGIVTVAGRVTHLGNNGNGVSWWLDRETAPLASKVLTTGGAGTFAVSSVGVQVGTRLFLIVDANGTNSYDWTNADLWIARQ